MLGVGRRELGIGNWALGVGCCFLVITLNYLVILEVYLSNVSEHLRVFYDALIWSCYLIDFILVILLEFFAHELFGIYFWLHYSHNNV
jgi:hypothetical protein